MSIDYRKGGNQKKMIVVHHTASVSSLQAMLNFFKRPDSISIHYVVDLQGNVGKQQVYDQGLKKWAEITEDDVAFHAGVSEWGRWKDINPVSIGIEIISNGTDFTDAQRDSVFKLCKEIMTRNNIPAENVVTHAHVAVPRGRKWDVGPNFYAPRWSNWDGFQKALMEPKKETAYEKEIKVATEWVKKLKISNGERPKDEITREEFWVSLKRYDKSK